MKQIGIVVAVGMLAVSSSFADDKALSPGVKADVVYGHKDGLALTFDVITPRKSNGAGVMFMVSGGWYSRWFSPEAAVQSMNRGAHGDFARLLKKGFTLFLVRHGSAPRYKVPDAVRDVRLAVRYVRKHAKTFQVDPERLGVFGGSAGGHLSLMLGTTGDDGKQDSRNPLEHTGNRVAAVVAYFPPTDLRKIMSYAERFPALKFDEKLVESVSPLLHVTEDDAPTLLIHGDKDKLVPIAHSEWIDEAFAEKKVAHKYLVIEGAAHGFRGKDGERAGEAMVSWFETHLLKKKVDAE